MREKTLRDDNYCLGCRSDLRGEPIPEEHRRYYNPDATHYSKVVGVEYAGGFDGISEWMCPVCGRREGRWTGKVLGEGETEPRYGGK